MTGVTNWPTHAPIVSSAAYGHFERAADLLPQGHRVRRKAVLAGLHHEYWLEKVAA
jgi:hypothetical protein